MAQRYDIVRINFQANARGANAAIESIRQKAEECNAKVNLLKQDIKSAENAKMPKDHIEGLRKELRGAEKDAKQFSNAYKELIKGMKVLDEGIDAFNNGTLNKMNAAFQKALYNAAKLTKTRLDPTTDTYKRDSRELTAVMDAAKQNYARLQGDAAEMVKTLKNGSKVSASALREELKAQQELLEVLSETDKGYQRTQKNVAVMSQYLRAMGGDYEFIRKNITDTKKVSDDMLRNMYTELDKTNSEGKVTRDILRENAKAMKEIRAEQANRVQNVLGGDLGKQSEGSIRAAIASAKELLVTYKTGGKEVQTLAAQIVNAEEHLKQYGVEAARAAAREASAIRTQEEAERQLQTTMNKRLSSLKTLSADALTETRKYWEAQRNGAEPATAAFNKAEAALKKIDNLQRSRKTGELDKVLANPAGHGISEVRNAVQEMEKLRDSVQQGIPVWQHYNKMVEQGKAYLDNLAKSEAAQRINTQMQQLTRLSTQGLAEVKSYWEAQVNGAERGSRAYAEAEAALNRITRLETYRKQSGAFRVTNHMEQYSDAEIRKAIQALEQLRDAQKHGSREWDMFNKRVQEAKQYLDEWAKADSVMNMETRMSRLPKLSDAALTETRRFWEGMVSGAEKGSKELAEYESHLQKVMQEESERRQLSNEIAVQRLSGNLTNLSEKEIREAIEAGKQLIQTYKTASPEAQALAKRIVDAEEHIKQYGLTAEQAARKEAAAVAEAARKREESHQAMEQQLKRGTGLTQSALKAQENYWQRLVDDPKAASNELARYYENLNKVRQIQKEQESSAIKANGISALDRFRSDTDYQNKASDKQLKEDAAAMKAYRDSLPKEGNLSLIRELDYYIGLTGKSAKGAAQSVMSLSDAEALAGKLGTKGFSANTNQLNAAKKALEEAQVAAGRGGKRFNELQAAINKVELELRRTGEVTAEVKAVLDKPQGRSFNELKQAVEQGRAALQNMRRVTVQEQKDFDELAKKVKAADIEMKQLGATSKGTASAFDKAWSRLKTYIGLYMGAAVAIQKLTATMGDLMELSDKMGEVRKTTGFTAEEVGKLTGELKKLDTRTGLTGLMELSAAAGQLGLKTERDVLGFTEAANKLMVALPEMGREGATEMLKVALATGEIDKIGKQMSQGLVSGTSATAVAMEKVGSTIDRLRATSAATAPAITDFVKRVGAVGAQSGITIDQVAALGSTVDALGMRVEMSATALSRMIPAIRNNAFAVAKAIGVAPEELRSLFDAGRGMEAILMILQHIKDSGMDEDSVENMLGIGGMQDVMKELNQQGARAGIVFAGLSQNVDELRRQLGVASEAYEENIAIQQEYDKMNETTAAKWERLKNQLEEAFIGDTAQRMLGGLIDALRGLVDFLTGNVGPALKFISGLVQVFLMYWAVLKVGLGEGIFVKAVGGLKSMATELTGLITNTGRYLTYSRLLSAAQLELRTATNAASVALAKEKIATIEARMAQEGLNKAMMANVWTALAVAIGFAIYKLYEAANATDKVNETFHRLQAEEEASERNINRLADSFKKTSTTLDATKKKHDELEEKTEKLRKEVDALTKSNDNSTESANALKRKEEELKKSEEDLKKSTEDMNKAQKEQSGIISEINSKYSSYLGYMLSEVTNAQLVESARWRIVAALRAELETKRQLENQNAIEEEYGDYIKKRTNDARGQLDYLPRDVQDQIMRRRSSMMAHVSHEMQETTGKDGKPVVVGRFVVPAIEGLSNRPKQFATDKEALSYIKHLTAEIVKQETVDRGVHLPSNGSMGMPKELTPYEYVDRRLWGGAYGSLSPNYGFQRLTAAELERMEKQSRQRYQDQGAVNGANAQVNKMTLNDINKNYQSIRQTIDKNIDEHKELDNKQIGELGRQLNAIVQSSVKYGGNRADVQRFFGAGKDMTLDNAAYELLDGLDQKTRDKVIAAAQRNGRAGTGGTTAPTYTPNPWGSNPEAESTDWKNMTADVLVSRRKQMNEFVKSIQTDTDVQAVLKEDAALKKAIDKGMSSDMRTVINWYNTERLKIQDELHARFLTNTGDWMDPKKQKARHKQFKDEIRAYLEELDAYYTERKTRIQEAGNEEGISEGEVWQRTIQNETEWRQRRAELQKMYSEHDIEVTAEEQDAIRKIIAERTGDTTEYITASIERTRKYADSVRKRDRNGAAEYEKWMANLGLGWEKDYLKQQNAIAKQVKAINDIISKERPFNGITENMQENLVKMGILTADMTAERDRLMDSGEDMTKFNIRQAEEKLKRTTWLLGEAENAYALTAEKMVEDMRNAGFGDWADTIEKDDSMKRAMLAQLHSTYDAVQDAIKKESSLIKKQVEIQWNDILSPDGKSMRQTFDDAISKLGLMGDQVKRANSLINAGYYSERVADKLAIKQMQVRLQMQEVYYNNVRKIGNERIADLKKQAKEARERGETEKALRLELDAQHAATSLNLSLSEEQKKVDEQRVAIQNQLEESQNRLYQSLREWATLLNDSVRSMIDASHAWDEEFYNERAKLDLTGKGGPGAGTYVIIEDANTSDAEAHYEYLNEREALDRQHEIEIQNAQAEAFRKVMDDLNMKMNEQITDSINAMLQDAAINNNTDRLVENTAAITGLNDRLSQGINVNLGGGGTVFGAGGGENPLKGFDETNPETWPRAMRKRAGYSVDENPHDFTGGEDATSVFLDPEDGGGISWMYEQNAEAAELSAERQVAAIDKVKYALDEQFNKQKEGTEETSKKQTEITADASKKTVTSTQSMYAKMTQAANLYGIAYQAMSNENLSTTQRVEMIGIQAAGNAAIAMLTAESTEKMSETEATLPAILAKCLNISPIAGAAIFAALTAIIGGLMGMAMAKVSKGKSQIAQATGVSAGAGRLSTGMLTYAEGNVNEFTDPATLTPGRSYDVDGADGKTYHARYMGKNARTHITNGPEFHLVGEAGREAIIDAKTTRQIQMDEPGIWSAIQTLYRGGRIASTRRRSGRGMPAFADGNIDELSGGESALDGGASAGSMGLEQMTAFQQSLDRNNELLERALTEGIKAVNKWDGPDGIPNMYNKYQKQAQRHGERYL